MSRTFLNVREWLEKQHLDGCEFAPELLDLLDGIGEQEAMGSALEDIHHFAPDIVNGSKLKFHEHQQIADWACGRLELLDSIESLIDDNSEGVTWPNGTKPVDLDDRLEAIFEARPQMIFDL